MKKLGILNGRGMTIAAFLLFALPAAAQWVPVQGYSGGVGDITSVAVTTTAPVTGSATCATGGCSFTLGLDTVPTTSGGTGLTTFALGDIVYASAADTLSALAGNTTTTKKFLMQVGDGVDSAAPSWTATAADFPTLNQNTTGSAAKWTTARLLAGNSVDGSANATFANAFIVQGTADAGLTGAQFLGALGTGIVKNTTTTGVLSIAAAEDFPTLNQDTTGSAAKLNSGADLAANAACTAGTVTYSATYVYVCIASGNVARAALTTGY